MHPHKEEQWHVEVINQVKQGIRNASAMLRCTKCPTTTVRITSSLIVSTYLTLDFITLISD